MHVQAFKLATLLAALDWLDTEEPVPTVTEEHWISGKAMLRCGGAVRHDCCIKWIAVGKYNMNISCNSAFWKCLDGLVSRVKSSMWFTVYKNLHVPARQTRQWCRCNTFWVVANPKWQSCKRSNSC
ncbi:MAG: hypothetical protein DPW16_22250 [Chloroflexi bacterium]|nr:hypothetical protein [Chloroflexota bacterium]